MLSPHQGQQIDRSSALHGSPYGVPVHCPNRHRGRCRHLCGRSGRPLHQDTEERVPLIFVIFAKRIMACNSDFVQFITDQCSGAGEIAVKKMMGDYCIYCDGVLFGLICDSPIPAPGIISISRMWMTGTIWRISSGQRCRS